MNVNLLRSIMIRHGDKQADLARFLGLPQSAVSERMNGHVSFRQTEIDAIRKRYNLSADELLAIFFAS